MNFWTWLQKLIQDWIASQTPKPTPPAPTPTPPAPVPVPPVPTPTPIVTHLNVWDALLIPDQMRQAGFQHPNDNALFFALFSIYGTHEWGDPGTNPLDLNLYNNGDKIKAWFTAYVAGIGNQLKANPAMTCTLIVSDRNDAGGCFMWQPIQSQLLSMGVQESQIEIGVVFQ